MSPKISIITPSFNQGEYIEQTILSVINQDYANFEFIIIDGGSTDSTVDIINKYGDHITYWVSEKDRGQAHAINKGLQVATGDFFNWLNSDDLLEKGALKEVGEFFAAQQNHNVLCGYTRCFWTAANTTSHEYRMGLKPTVTETVAKVEMNQPGTFYRTSEVRNLGGINQSLRYVFDDELWFRYLCRYGMEGIGTTNKRLAQFRLHGSSKSVGEGYHLFHLELQSIFMDIAVEAGAPDWLLQQMARQPHSDKYLSRGPWNLQFLEQEKYLAHFAAKYLNTLYLNGQKQQAKEALKIIVRNGYFQWNRTMASIWVKLLFS